MQARLSGLCTFGLPERVTRRGAFLGLAMQQQQQRRVERTASSKGEEARENTPRRRRREIEAEEVPEEMNLIPCY